MSQPIVTPSALAVLLELLAETADDPALTALHLQDNSCYWTLTRSRLTFSFYSHGAPYEPGPAVLDALQARFGGTLTNERKGEPNVDKRLTTMWHGLQCTFNIPVPHISEVEQLRQRIAELETALAAPAVTT